MISPASHLFVQNSRSTELQVKPFSASNKWEREEVGFQDFVGDFLTADTADCIILLNWYSSAGFSEALINYFWQQTHQIVCYTLYLVSREALKLFRGRSASFRKSCWQLTSKSASFSTISLSSDIRISRHSKYGQKAISAKSSLLVGWVEMDWSICARWADTELTRKQFFQITLLSFYLSLILPEVFIIFKILGFH